MKHQHTLFNVLTIILLTGFGVFFAALRPVDRGFWCNDDSIRYPRSKETVSPSELALFSLLLPFLIILIGETLRHNLAAKDETLRTNQRNINQFWSDLGNILMSWLFCYFVNFFITSFIKYRVGRLRPIFITVCQPDVSCSDGFQNQHQYITNFTCSVDQRTENFLRSSFPSGHASHSMASMIFLIIYLSKRFQCSTYRYVISLSQISALCLALYIGLSRVSDNIHHWSDVLAGFIIGTGVTLVLTFTIATLDHFDNRTKSMIKTSGETTRQLDDF